jgi:hypothetical protein
MKKNDRKDEPRDEFDHVMLPGFLAKPLGFLTNTTPDGPALRENPTVIPPRRDGNPNSGNPFAASPSADPYDPDSYRTTSDADSPRYDDEDDEAARQAAPTKWWAGSKGRILIYAGSAVLWIFIQSRT